MMGGRLSGDPKSSTDALLGSMQTIVFHANSDPDTLAWAIKYFANRWHFRASHSGGDEKVGMSQQLDPMITAQAIQELKRGGSRDGFVVEALMARSARPWKATSKPFLKVAFGQEAVHR